MQMVRYYVRWWRRPLVGTVAFNGDGGCTVSRIPRARGRGRQVPSGSRGHRASTTQMSCRIYLPHS